MTTAFNGRGASVATCKPLKPPHEMPSIPTSLQHHSCRAIGFNRQQFSKYLSGASHPSPYNLHRICNYFGVKPASIYLPHEEFIATIPNRARESKTAPAPSIHRHLHAAFRGHAHSLQPYLGFYLTHCYTSSWEGYILRALTHLYASDGLIATQSIERIRDPQDRSLFVSKYDGLAALLGNRLFMVEYQSHAKDAIVETVLYPRGRGQLRFLRGITFGISSLQRNPYVSRSVWQYLGATTNLRGAMRMVGLFPTDSSEINPHVWHALGKGIADDHLFPHTIAH